ncbi:hypothetical protein CPB86DRAFT_777947 [Serendipita vermifera]|nr:hypothetical protein CPB86DRAFT_777947 [Serendipita vermifera]
MSNVFAIGASRNIGYYASQKMLARGDTVTLLLRNTTAIENDESFKPYIASGKARLVKGDATSHNDVSAAWKVATQDAPVDLVMFTLGAVTGTFSLTKGVIMNPPDLCTSALLILSKVISESQPTAPKIVILSSTGLTPESKRVLPLPLRPLYGWLLHNAHADKRGLESVLFHAMGKEYEQGQIPGEPILKADWKKELPAEGWAKHAVVIRAALLTDGRESGVYQATVGDRYAWFISRRDVAHFIVEELTPNWEKYDGNIVTIGY